jgi:hypothetical protein
MRTLKGTLEATSLRYALSGIIGLARPSLGFEE